MSTQMQLPQLCLRGWKPADVIKQDVLLRHLLAVFCLLLSVEGSWAMASSHSKSRHLFSSEKALQGSQEESERPREPMQSQDPSSEDSKNLKSILVEQQSTSAYELLERERAVREVAGSSSLETIKVPVDHKFLREQSSEQRDGTSTDEISGEEDRGTLDKGRSFYVDVKSRRIRDGFGRERVFHGLNVVVKGPPWHPVTDCFDARMSLADADVALIRGWGLNVVRLGVMWPGVEPQQGIINATYMKVMKGIVGKLASAGIQTVIEFHQDLFSEHFCGEGVPDWLIEKAVEEYKLHHSDEQGTKGREREVTSHDGGWAAPPPYVGTFPEPLGKRFFTSPQPSGVPLEGGGRPSAEQCTRHEWFNYHFTYAVSRAFQDLYDNRWGWADAFTNYWREVATAFRGQEGVLGYELVNEPWAGDIFRDPALLFPRAADRRNVARLYDRLQFTIRAADPHRLIFFDGVTFDNFGTGFQSVPGGPQHRNTSVLGYHYYRPPQFAPPQEYISTLLAKSARLGCAAMMTEFFITPLDGADCSQTSKGKRSLRWEKERDGLSSEGGDGRSELSKGCARAAEDIEAVFTAADANVQSWIGWVYKGFVEKTGSSSKNSVFDTSEDGGRNGSANANVARSLARAYPRIVAGTIVSFSFDPKTSAFTLLYIANGAQGPVHPVRLKPNKRKAHEVRETLGEIEREEKIRIVKIVPSSSFSGEGRNGSRKGFLKDPWMPSREDPSMVSEIFVHRRWYYRRGLRVETNRECAWAREGETQLYIVHDERCAGLLVLVKVVRV